MNTLDETRSTKGSHYKLRPYLIQRGGGVNLWIHLVETMLDAIVYMLSIVLFIFGSQLNSPLSFNNIRSLGPFCTFWVIVCIGKFWGLFVLSDNTFCFYSCALSTCYHSQSFEPL